MVEKAKDPKKGSITEEDTATLLQRYAPTTVLTLLQEVANQPEGKIDWNRLVAKTSTGISNAREYQMLWRHLAYREALLDKFDNGAQPLDDDSDLEYEVEAFPAVSAEASAEAAACVKVLISSGLSSDSSHQNGLTVEGPLPMILPNGQSSRSHQNSQPTCSMQGKNITVPVSVLKNPLPAVTMSAVETAEGDDALGNGMAPRKRRKKWSEAEDMELIAAVQKYGEGNWANILRGDFKGDRTPGQLAQRWKNIRKNNLDLIVGGGSSSKLSEAQLAARHSLSIALNMPNITANTIGTAGTSTHSKLAGTNATSKLAGINATRNSVHSTTGEAKLQSQQGLNPVKAEAKPQSQQGLNPVKTYQTGLSGPTTKAPVIAKKTIPKLTDSMVRAAAVAAGARIAFPSDAASLLKAAQAKNAVHIMPTVGSSTQSVKPGGMSTYSELPPNVHIMRSSSAASATPLSIPSSTAATPSTTRPRSSKVLLQASQHTPTNDAMLSRQTNGVSCNLDTEPGCAPTEQVQDGAVISRDGPNDQVEKDKRDSPDQKAESKNLSPNAENPVDSLKIESDETDSKAVTGVQAEERKSAKDNEIPCSSVNVGSSDPSAVDSCENRSASEKQTDLLAMATDGCKGKQVVSKEEGDIKI